MSERPMLEGVRAEREPAPAFEAPELYDGIRLKRSIAFLIDALLIGAAWLAWWIVGGLLTFVTLGLLNPILVIGGVLLPFAYHTWFIGGDWSATPGMRVMNLRAVTTDGGRPGWLQAFVLTALFYFSIGVTSWLILLISLFNPRGRCLHDFLAGVLIQRADVRPPVAYTVERAAP